MRERERNRRRWAQTEMRERATNLWRQARTERELRERERNWRRRAQTEMQVRERCRRGRGTGGGWRRQMQAREMLERL